MPHLTGILQVLWYYVVINLECFKSGWQSLSRLLKVPLRKQTDQDTTQNAVQ